MTLIWQRLDAPVSEQAAVSFGAGLTLTACGGVRREDGGALLRYRMCTNRKGWVSQVVIDVETPRPARLKLQRRMDGRWLVNDEERPEFDGCSEFGLQSGELPHAFPLRRLRMAEGDAHHLRCVSVAIPDLSLRILPVSYTRLADQAGRARYRFCAAGRCAEILVDGGGLPERGGGFLRRLPAAA